MTGNARPLTRPLRIGLIGAGMVSRHHLLAWATIPDQARVVAVADPSAENGARRAGEFGIGQTYANAEAMLAATELDAVDIAAPREMHAPLVRLAAQKRLPVLCQKPLAPNLQEATELAAEVEGLTRLMVHENWRFRGYYRDAALWLREGRIGNTKQAQLTLLTSGVLPGPDGLCPRAGATTLHAQERRMLVAEVLIHHLDTLRMLLGPLRVTAAQLFRSSDLLVSEDGAVIQLCAENGAVFGLCKLRRSWSSRRSGRSAGDSWRQWRYQARWPSLTCSGISADARTYDLAAEYQGSYNRTIAHFVKSLRDDTPFETAPQDNLETLRLVEDCYRLSGREALR